MKRKEKSMALFFGYTERSIFRFKASADPRLKERYNALSSHKPFIKYLKKEEKK